MPGPYIRELYWSISARRARIVFGVETFVRRRLKIGILSSSHLHGSVGGNVVGSLGNEVSKVVVSNRMHLQSAMLPSDRHVIVSIISFSRQNIDIHSHRQSMPSPRGTHCPAHVSVNCTGASRHEEQGSTGELKLLGFVK